MFPDRWTGENLRAALAHPELVERELRTWVARVTEPLSARRNALRHEDGVDVLSEDWDTLVILDACRDDYFQEHNTIEGALQSVTSVGSTSSEFIEANFIGRELHDTVYVTANPYVELLADDTFYAVENLLVDEWRDDIGTVPPAAVADAALAAHERHPHKRLVVHFMQPHTPYLGPTARQLREQLDLNDGYNKYQCVDGQDTKLSGGSWFGAAMQGDIALSELRTAYEETLELGLEQANRVVAGVDGRTVVTADHGELLGERLGVMGHRRYGHPAETDAPELRVVPWLTVEGAARRTVVADEPVGFQRLADDVAADRLRALGYVPE